MDAAGAPAVSSAGGTNGVVWVVDTRADGPRAGAGTLYALNALTGAVLYASAGPDALGATHQFISPAIAGQRVYVGAGHTVVAYALRDR
jgi:outer membrane protein assembly factor BamB